MFISFDQIIFWCYYKIKGGIDMGQFIIPYLAFKDSLKTAEYYKKVFNGKIEYIMKGKDMPNCPEKDLDKVMHLELVFNNNVIYMSDGDARPTDQAMLLLNYEHLDIMKEAYNNMKIEGKIVRELAETFWGAIYGVVEDPYGMKWEFHYTIPKN